MPGIMYGDTLPVHNELDAVAGAYVNAIAKGKLTKLTPVWKKGLCSIYDTYLGKCPENFTYKGKEYTPKTFAESLGINPDDYISLTSFTHHPFYTQMNIEIQDNWRNGLSYNLPLMEFMSVIDNAVNNGYTVAWGSDVSESGFTRDGIAVMPDADRGAELTGSDMARWTGLTAADKRKELTSRPLPEITVTQEMRQTAFDNWETTTNHLFNSQLLQQCFGHCIFVYQDIDSFVSNERFRSIPSTFVFVVGTPGVLYHVVFFTVLVFGYTVDKHTVVIGSFPIVECCLAHFLSYGDFR